MFSEKSLHSGTCADRSRIRLLGRAGVCPTVACAWCLDARSCEPVCWHTLDQLRVKVRLLQPQGLVCPVTMVGVSNARCWVQAHTCSNEADSLSASFCRLDKLWFPPSTQAQRDKAYDEQYYPAAGRYESVIVQRRDGGDVLTPLTFNRALQLVQQTLDVEWHNQGTAPWLPRAVSFTDVCLTLGKHSEVRV